MVLFCSFSFWFVVIEVSCRRSNIYKVVFDLLWEEFVVSLVSVLLLDFLIMFLVMDMDLFLLERKFEMV